MSELQRILANFNLPEERKHDLQWLNRNIAIANTGHRDLGRAMELIRQLLRENNEDRQRNLFR